MSIIPTCTTCGYANHAGFTYVQGEERKDIPIIYCELEYAGEWQLYSYEYMNKCPQVQDDHSCGYHTKTL